MPVGSAVSSEARAAAAAVGLLTRIPVFRSVSFRPEDVARSAMYFPWTGLVIGGAVGVSAVLLADVVPSLGAAALAIGLGALLTGALHLDALADTADALGGRDRQHALEIMRDHHLGSFGAVALLLVLLAQASAIADLAIAREAAWIAAPFVLARATPPLLAVLLPYARAGDGLGRPLSDQGSLPRALAAVLLALLIAFALTGENFLPLALSIAVTAGLMGVFFWRWLGGVTGDALGAALLLSESTALLTASALT